MAGGLTDFRSRLLLWHRGLTQITGTITLSYGGKGVSRAAMADWASRLRDIASDMESVKDIDSSKLDLSRRSVLLRAASTAPLAHEAGKEKFFGKTQETVYGPAGVKARMATRTKASTIETGASSASPVGGRPILKKATRRTPN